MLLGIAVPDELQATCPQINRDETGVDIPDARPLAHREVEATRARHVEVTGPRNVPAARMTGGILLRPNQVETRVLCAEGIHTLIVRKRDSPRAGGQW